MSGEKRWVVLSVGGRYVGHGGARPLRQRDAMRMAKESADEWEADGYEIRRLISRSEAVERASRAAYMRALEDVASMLDRCAQTQDHAAWEAAQAGLTALVAKHETVAGSYRLAARSAREMGR